MTRPDEPTEALPTRALPVTPPGDADAAEPTVHLVAPRAAAEAEPTVSLSAVNGEPTVPLSVDGAEPTVPLARPEVDRSPDAEPTVHLSPAPAPATAPIPAPGTVTGQATVRPRPAPPARGPGVEPTVSWQPTGVPHGHQAGGPPAATGAGAYPDRTVGARAPSGVPAPAPGGELRFGPGVPVTPPPAPPWPTAPPIRPRPVWRRVVSVLSTLLTAALLLTVGLYLWQRLRPMEVEQVSVAANRPAGVACDVTVDVVATVRTNGRAGTIRYQWFRSDGPPGAVLTERVGSGQHTATLTLEWTFSGVGTTVGTATVTIIEPAPMPAGTRVRYRCPGG
ncbi:hypothetical protein [Micromonospora sp. D75]|uniref:hypothetical protein n=1 Tax=Micromonospora sp. D75 TaxID=2824885 RepID=UPI001B36999F|nr:hypothetical protein [Micromonospora sp. D75]MBQ1068581.1 hypothetical protein [Micromonospora sp. D75]